MTKFDRRVRAVTDGLTVRAYQSSGSRYSGRKPEEYVQLDGNVAMLDYNDVVRFNRYLTRWLAACDAAKAAAAEEAANAAS